MVRQIIRAQMQCYAGKIPSTIPEPGEMGVDHDMHMIVKIVVATLVINAFDDAPSEVRH